MIIGDSPDIFTSTGFDLVREFVARSVLAGSTARASLEEVIALFAGIIAPFQENGRKLSQIFPATLLRSLSRSTPRS
jgi:hypothetical protein